MKFRSIIFDMDGTLVDSLMVWDVIWDTLGEKYLGVKKFRPSPRDDKAVRTLTLALGMEMICGKYDFPVSAEELTKECQKIVKDFYSQKVALKKGVKEFLEMCRVNGTKMCIASATDLDLIHVALKHCGIEQYFPKILSCSTIGKGKEFPDIFLAAAKEMGTAPEETWVFEDSLVAVKTATEIGMKTVAVYDRYNYGQDEMEKIATIYISKDEDFSKVM